jgi:peptide/nickel transport system ATP-binding protein
MAAITTLPASAQPADSSPRVGQPLLQIEELGVHFESTGGLARVVDGANLDVRRNEVFGIAGESGCGKTTLVEAILQIIRFPNRVTSGSVRFFPTNGKPVDLMTLSPAEMRRFRWKHISYIPQGSMNSLNPVMRVGEQIADGMTAHGVNEREARQRIPSLLQRVGLEEKVAGLYPHELSGGMKQRVIIASAIAMGPELIIADEPTTALDVNVQRVILETLVKLRDELGVSILTVSHDLPVHAQLVDRIGVMYAGKIVEIGAIRPVLKMPLHPYTQGLMASIPEIGGLRQRIDGIAGTTPSPYAWPEGCRFNTRCPYAMEICRQQEPALALIQPGPRRVGEAEVEVSADRFAACHLHPESTHGEPA